MRFLDRDIPEDVLNTYCWIHSTYTVIDAFMKTPGNQVAYPGVENSFTRSPTDKNHTKHVKYYQWVAFMLFFQVSALNSFIFYFVFVWACLERCEEEIFKLVVMIILTDRFSYKFIFFSKK